MNTEQLLASKVDNLAHQLPDQVYCVHPVSPSLSDGWREITYRSLADAANFLAWWIQRTIQCEVGQTLAYIGTNDLRYIALILAGMKTGNPVLLLSPRNSNQGFSHLLTETRCSTLIFTRDKQRAIRGIVESSTNPSTLQTLEIPPLWTVFFSKTAMFEFNLQYADVVDLTTVIIHTSGTTGLPKPVRLTHGYFGVLGNLRNLPVPPGRKHSSLAITSHGQLRLNMGPFFHFVGLACLIECVLFETPFVQCPDCPMTARLFASIVAETKPLWMLATPSFLQDLVQSQEGLSALSSLKQINYGGATLSPECGNLLAKNVHLQTAMGSSETGYIASLQCEDRLDWDSFEWNPAFGVHMDDLGDGLCELVIPRHESRDFHGVFHSLPLLSEYRTGDLFVSHPAKARLWKYYGRRDDIIVLSNGEMFNPIGMEQVIEKNPEVSKALIVGQGRFEAALLIEPHWSHANTPYCATELVRRILPSIHRANAIGPSHGRILANRILLASEAKPFKVTPKGTVKRRAVEVDYHRELEELYSRDDIFTLAFPPTDASYSELETYVQKAVATVANVDSIDKGHDIFTDVGLDSLHALQLSSNFRSIVHRLRPGLTEVHITIEDVYLRPTVGQLTRMLYESMSGTPPSRDLATAQTKDHSQIERMISRLSRGWGKQYTVLLTGSTGAFGTYILYELVRDPSIKRVICLNRSDDAQSRQWSKVDEGGLGVPHALRNKVGFLHADLADTELGLGRGMYEDIAEAVDIILHNSWLVNFNASIESYEHPHLLGVRRLIEFAMRCRKKPQVHFVSSVSALGAWRSDERIPEEVVHNVDAAPLQGYGLSKYIAEHIMNQAVQECGILGCVYRVGQLAGPTARPGVWNKHEWFPSLVLTSKSIGQLPQSLGPIQIDWIPIDTAATCLVEIMHTCADKLRPGTTAVFNLVNPQPTAWETLLPTLQVGLDSRVVPLDDWIKTLESCSEPRHTDIEDKPALKLLNFFRSLRNDCQSAPQYVVRLAQEYSQTMKQLGPIDGEMLIRWLMQWEIPGSYC